MQLYTLQLEKGSVAEVIEGIGVSDGDRTHDHWSHNLDQPPKKPD